ncbi:hypothetical protein A2803_02555, partial [Candidatus Woesebacteria bacterium RIFCSPHIGHO2_01_FULL_44_21]
LIRTALKDFGRSKVRTGLTSLGILIGVFSVVMLISLGLGLRNYITRQFEDLGTNLIIILPGSGFSQGFGAGLAGGADFDERDIKSLEKIGDLEYVVPVFMKAIDVVAGKEEEFGYVMGTSDDFFGLYGIDAEAGEVFTKGDMQGRSKKVVLGKSLAEKLFGDFESAVGRDIKVQNQKYEVIGVSENVGDDQLDNAVLMPYRTTYGNLNPGKTFFAIYVGVADEDKVAAAKELVEKELLKRYEEDDFEVSEQEELLATINQIISVVNAVLIAIGSISLVVGGIGIMNIMYANVTERTKEVGIRRAIGATKRDILLQFLTESVLLSLLGGIVGLALAALVVLIVQPYFPLGLDAVAVAVALGISSAIGIFFGVFPARRAANLTPIEAIRYE